MRKTMAALLAGVLVLSGVNLIPSGEEKDGRAIVEKAIKAAGGADVLAKHSSATFKGKGTYYGMGDGLPYSGNYAFQWPDKFRMEIEGVFIIVLNGDKGWIKEGDETKDLSKEQLDQQRMDQKAGWITTLLPLKDKAFQVTATGEVTINRQPALGVKVTRKDYPDVTLFFDKESGLLVKSSFKTKSPEQKFKEVEQNNYYADFRVVEGAKLPAKMMIKRDDKLFVEEVVSDYKAGKVNAKLFTKP